jgi:hypothetical protein
VIEAAVVSRHSSESGAQGQAFRPQPRVRQLAQSRKGRQEKIENQEILLGVLGVLGAIKGFD